MTKPRTGTETWTRRQLWLRWQLVRRKDEYRNFCDTHEKFFRLNTHPIKGTTHQILDESAEVLPVDTLTLVETVRARFGLDLLYHYTCEFDENDIVRAIVFQKPYAVRPLYTVEGDGTRTPLWKGRFMRVEVDLFAAEAEIKAELIELLRSARIVSNDERSWRPARPPTEMDFRIYDLRRLEGWTRQQVMAAVWPEEYKIARKQLSGDDRDKLYKELRQKYKREGHKEYDDMAYFEAYPDPEKETEEREKKPLTTLYMRVHDAIKRVEAALDNV